MNEEAGSPIGVAAAKVPWAQKRWFEGSSGMPSALSLARLNGLTVRAHDPLPQH